MYYKYMYKILIKKCRKLRKSIDFYTYKQYNNYRKLRKANFQEIQKGDTKCRKVIKMKYNYYETMKEDVKNYLEENNLELNEDTYNDIYDEMFISDEITGNASGSYTFNTYKAEENICHNLDLLEEACEEFCCEPKLDNAEWCDVTIRCYLLGQVLSEMM